MHQEQGEKGRKKKERRGRWWWWGREGKRREGSRKGKRVRKKKESFLALLTQPAGGSLKTLSCFIHLSLAKVGLPQQKLSRVHLSEVKHIHHSNIVLVYTCV